MKKTRLYSLLVLLCFAVFGGLAVSGATVVCDTENFKGYYDVTASGWVYDNRGGTPLGAGATFAAVNDTSNQVASALYRDFSAVTEGKLFFEGGVTFTSGFDGARFLFTDGASTAFSLETVGKAFAVRKPDGSLETVFTPESASGSFAVRLFLDLDEANAELVINETKIGVYPLLADSVSRFAYATTTPAKVTFKPLRTKIVTGFTAFDDFDAYAADTGKLPYGWVSSDVSNAGAKSGEAFVGSGAILRKDFTADGDTVIELTAFVPAGVSGTLSLFGDSGLLCPFIVSGGVFKIDGTTVYTYKSDMWYRLRFELAADGSVLFKLNGRRIGVYPLRNAFSTVTRAAFNFNGGSLRFDDFKVFPIEDPADYVSAPVRPAGEDAYLVGVNVCSLWDNDAHYGWNTVTPFEKPVLGWYDEGDPETADWEIRYLAEHGVDFEAFCWYADTASSPLKKPALSAHLHDGYMNARYADDVKYMLIWECANGEVPTTLDDAKAYVIPYLIENYFKDDRYLVIDNKPVLGFFGIGKLMNALTFGNKDSADPGDWRELKKCLDAIETAAKAVGYDGVLFMSTDTSNSYLAAAGVDASFAYGWGVNGYSVEYNKQKILESAGDGSVYTIPTISVGFNKQAWYSAPTPMMTVSDYAAAHAWVKNTYLPQYAAKAGPFRNMVMLSSWNEFGEGTYIFPCENNGGFGYLDVIRAAYTSEAASAAVNVLPTAAQKARITRKYPQDLVRIRPLGSGETTDGNLTLAVDGRTVTLPFDGEERDDDVYFPFDPTVMLHEKMGVHYAFDGTTLTVYGGNGVKTAAFTVGESAYTVDGLPTVPFGALCEALEMPYTFDGTTFDVQSERVTLTPPYVRIVSFGASGGGTAVTVYTAPALGNNRTAVVAGYDGEGRLLDARIAYPADTQTFSVYFSNVKNVKIVKVFIMRGRERLTPVCEPTVAKAGEDNIIDVGGLLDD